MCGVTTNPIGDIDVYYECLLEMTDYVEFYDCFNRGVHGRAHTTVGGSRRAYLNQTNANRCFLFGNAFTNEINGVRKMAYNYGCYDCPEVNDCEFGVDDPFECASCTIANGTCEIEGETVNFRVQYDQQQIQGDFVDIGTSPNDPLFIFHHGMKMFVFSIEHIRHKITCIQYSQC